MAAQLAHLRRKPEWQRGRQVACWNRPRGGAAPIYFQAAGAGYVVAMMDFDRDGVDVEIKAGGAMRPSIGLQLKAERASKGAQTALRALIQAVDEVGKFPSLQQRPGTHQDRVVRSVAAICLQIRHQYFRSATRQTTSISANVRMVDWGRQNWHLE